MTTLFWRRRAQQELTRREQRLNHEAKREGEGEGEKESIRCNTMEYTDDLPNRRCLNLVSGKDLADYWRITHARYFPTAGQRDRCLVSVGRTMGILVSEYCKVAGFIAWSGVCLIGRKGWGNIHFGLSFVKGVVFLRHFLDWTTGLGQNTNLRAGTVV